MKNFKEKQCRLNNCKIIFKPASSTQKYCPNCKVISKSIKDKKYRVKNHSIILEKKKDYRLNNKDKVSISNINYMNNGGKAKRNLNYKNRSSNDIEFNLRNNISSSINSILKRNNSSKNNNSCLKYLGYTIKELKQHLESKFENWMTWNNRGCYKKEEWNEEDNSTWKWQIDHIIPHSTFKYTDMNSEEFKRCWSLENLQPLSAKQNQLDGATRIRHKENSFYEEAK